MDYKKAYEELNICYYPLVQMLRFSKLNKKMTEMGFVAALPSEYDSVKAQIMSSLEILPFQETFNKILNTEISSHTFLSAQMNSALVGRNIGEPEKQQYRNSGQGGNSRGSSSGGVVFLLLS